MTKTIETAKKPFFKEDALYGHIADTYFYQKNRQKTRRKKSPNPINIPVKLLIAPAAFIAVLAAILIAASIFHHNYISYVKANLNKAKIINIIDAGAINRDLVKNIQVRGGAQKDKARSIKGLILFDNPTKYRWADIAIDFKFPVDFSKRYLKLSMRGEVGGERLNIVLRDSKNRSMKLDNVYLSSKWTDKIIKLDPIKGDIDLSDISHIRIESAYTGESSKDMDSPINLKAYIKNITIAKET